jgi:PDZ domain-containing protein
VQQFITVPADKGHPVKHPVLLTDVELGRVTAASYLFDKLQGNTTLEPLVSITGGTPPSEVNAQGVLEMSQAEAAAKAAAFHQLGYQVTATPVGVVVAGTYPATPAFGALAVGDVITAVDGTPVTDVSQFQTSISGRHSGQTVKFTVRKGGTGPAVPVSVTLKTTRVNTGEVNSHGQPVMATVVLGVQVEDQVDYSSPFPVSINVADIGGPSAGLAMTLGVIDELTGGSLTGGKTVAATGTIDAQGDVGDVGGVPQKTVAVENAGASIFLVPPQEYQAAKSKDRPGLQIYAVSTLDQALAVLARHGGHVPPAPTGSPPTSSSR